MNVFLVVVGVFNILQSLVIIGLGVIGLLVLYLHQKKLLKGGKK